MPSQSIWKTISNDLLRAIGQGQLSAGDKLPTEQNLAAQYGVNRHTVRQALSDLAAQNLVWSKRGSGVFVTSQKTSYQMGKRVRFTENIRASGRTPTRDVLQIVTQRADSSAAQALGITAGDDVHVFYGISKSDDVPVALFKSVFDAQRFPELKAKLEQYSSVTQALAASGVMDYTRRWTQITAVLADPVQANHLKIKSGDPLMRATSLNTDASGAPVEFGSTHFVGDRIQLTYDDEPSPN